MQFRTKHEVKNDLDNVEMLLNYLSVSQPLVNIYLKENGANWSINQQYITALVQAANLKVEYYKTELLISDG